MQSRSAAVKTPVSPRNVPRSAVPPKSAIPVARAKPLPVKATGIGTRVPARKLPTGQNRGRIINQPTKPMGKMKGMIGGAKKLGAMAGMLPGAYGKIAGLAASVLPDGTVVHHKRRHKGLTYNEIRGANRVLKLVKKFAPAGHKTALKVSRRRA